MNQQTAEIVKEYLAANPILTQYLTQGLINYSALARSILPKVKLKNPKARIESVLIAIQRNVSSHPYPVFDKIRTILSTTEVSLTGDIVQLVFVRSKENEKLIFHKILQRKDSGLCIVSQTRQEIAVFVSKHILNFFEDNSLKISFMEKNLAVLGLHETKISRDNTSQYIPGYIAHLSFLFAQNNISIVEIVSCHAQILFFVKEKDASLAYELLRNHIQEIEKDSSK